MPINLCPRTVGPSSPTCARSSALVPARRPTSRRSTARSFGLQMSTKAASIPTGYSHRRARVQVQLRAFRRLRRHRPHRGWRGGLWRAGRRFFVARRHYVLDGHCDRRAAFHHDPACFRCRLGRGHPPPVRARSRCFQVARAALRAAVGDRIPLSQTRAMAVDGFRRIRRGPRRRERCRLPQKGGVPEPADVYHLLGDFLWHLDLAVLPACAARRLAQDADGDAKWTRHEPIHLRPLASRSPPFRLTFAAIFWMKSLEYHWFSTMYGVYYFADCMRGALLCGVFIMVWSCIGAATTRESSTRTICIRSGSSARLYGLLGLRRIRPVLPDLECRNVPEETFWFNEREIGQWWWSAWPWCFSISCFHSCYLLFYRNKIVHQRIRFIAGWNLTSSSSISASMSCPRSRTRTATRSLSCIRRCSGPSLGSRHRRGVACGPI